MPPMTKGTTPMKSRNGEVVVSTTQDTDEYVESSYSLDRNGVLTILDETECPVVSYAPGSWKTVSFSE